MRGSPILLFLAATMHAATARADFVITSMPPVKTAPPIVQTIPDKSPEPASTRRFKLAFGFGDRIPLSFAVRQIVPPAVKVTYGPGADPNAPVDWKGGQAWNRVLSEAVKPLALRLVVSRMAVEIRK